MAFVSRGLFAVAPAVARAPARSITMITNYVNKMPNQVHEWRKPFQANIEKVGADNPTYLKVSFSHIRKRRKS